MSTCSGVNVTLVLDMIILSIVKWNAAFRRCPANSNTSIRNFCDKCIAQKIKFFIQDFFSKCDQICRKLWIWLHLLKKSLMKNLIFSAVVFVWDLAIVP